MREVRNLKEVVLDEALGLVRIPRSMRVFPLLLLVASALPGTEPWAFAQSSITAGDHRGDVTAYRLVWSDEFNQDGPPDPTKWNFEHGFVRNHEHQWYQAENAFCKGGLLVIEARRERVENSNFTADGRDWRQKRRYAEFTSACVTTRGLHSWKFARMEVRARIDARNGLWPAIWTVGAAGRWPASGEIDLMEYYQGQLLANACWSSGVPWQPMWDSVKKPLSELGDREWASNFHTWRMDWNEQRIELFVDDLSLNTIELNQTVGKKKQQGSPFRQPHYLLLNLAVGGTRGGDPAATVFPGKFEVDYVRVFQR